MDSLFGKSKADTLNLCTLIRFSKIQQI